MSLLKTVSFATIGVALTVVVTPATFAMAQQATTTAAPVPPAAGGTTTAAGGNPLDPNFWEGLFSQFAQQTSIPIQASIMTEAGTNYGEGDNDAEASTEPTRETVSGETTTAEPEVPTTIINTAVVVVGNETKDVGGMLSNLFTAPKSTPSQITFPPIGNILSSLPTLNPVVTGDGSSTAPTVGNSSSTAASTTQRPTTTKPKGHTNCTDFSCANSAPAPLFSVRGDRWIQQVAATAAMLLLIFFTIAV